MFPALYIQNFNTSILMRLYDNIYKTCDPWVEPFLPKEVLMEHNW